MNDVDKGILKEIAEQLEKWVDEVKEGGWSSQHVKPMKELTRKIYVYIGKHS